MRFKEFLLRESPLGLLDGLKIVKEKCTQFINDTDKTISWLYRGMHDEPTDVVFRKNHLIGRDPRDSSLGFNLFFNAGIEHALKIPNVRSTSVFASGDIAQTTAYGHTYFVFPTEYKFIWSEDIADSYIMDNVLYDEFAGHLKQLTGNKSTTLQIKNAFAKLVELSGGNLARATQNLNTHDKMLEDIFLQIGVHASAEHIDLALKLTFAAHYTANQGMSLAIDSHHEIFIYKSDGIYYVPRALVQAHISSDKKLDGQSPEEFLEQYFGARGA